MDYGPLVSVFFIDQHKYCSIFCTQSYILKFLRLQIRKLTCSISLSLSPRDLVWIPSYVLQVLAVIFGGMSILSGHVSTEQLTKYILYCEWLIYAAWRLQDSMSSLLQSVGACAKVFQLMHLPPSSEFMSKGRNLFLTIFFLLWCIHERCLSFLFGVVANFILVSLAINLDYNECRSKIAEADRMC